MIKRLFKLAHPKFQKLILEYPVSFEPRYGHGQEAHPQLLSIIDNRKEEYEKWLHAALKYTHNFQSVKNNTDKPSAQEPFWNNLFLPGLDMVMLYTAISELKPKRYVEIGSGNSTKVAHKAITEQGLKTEIISIDPMPRAEIDALANTIIRSPFEDCDFDPDLRDFYFFVQIQKYEPGNYIVPHKDNYNVKKLHLVTLTTSDCDGLILEHNNELVKIFDVAGQKIESDLNDWHWVDPVRDLRFSLVVGE
jgi:hypothetical protein